MESDQLNTGELEALEKLLNQKQEDRGGESNAIQDSTQARGSFLMTAMRSINENKDYRQELKTAFFVSPRKQMQMVLAIAEMKECGMEETVVIDLMLAQKAGEKGGFIQALLNALTHSSYTYSGLNAKKKWWQSPDNNKPQE